MTSLRKSSFGTNTCDFEKKTFPKQSNHSKKLNIPETWTGPGWGPVRVGAWSGLGPIWAHMGPYVFLKKVTFRVQTAPFGKIRMDFWRSRKRLYIPDLLKAKKSSVKSTFSRGQCFIKSVMFRVQTAQVMWTLTVPASWRASKFDMKDYFLRPHSHVVLISSLYIGRTEIKGLLRESTQMGSARKHRKQNMF